MAMEASVDVTRLKNVNELDFYFNQLIQNILSTATYTALTSRPHSNNANKLVIMIKMNK